LILYQIFNQILKQPISKEEISWLMRVSSPDPVHLTVDKQQVPKGHEFGDYRGASRDGADSRRGDGEWRSTSDSWAALTI